MEVRPTYSTWREALVSIVLEELGLSPERLLAAHAVKADPRLLAYAVLQWYRKPKGGAA